jgi:NAD(P)H-flavin reductase
MALFVYVAVDQNHGFRLKRVQSKLGGLNMLEFEGHIAETRDETHDVKTFVIEVTNQIDFIPGQYCMVSLPGNKAFRKEWRPFTFVNIPKNEYVELMVKRMGAFTTAMHNMHPGDKLLLKGPFGEQLNFDESIKDDVVFVAGGSGITPFISAIRFAASRNMPNRIILLYSNKTVDDIIDREELEVLGKRENITVIHSLTKKIPEHWKGIRGRVNKDVILTHVDDPKEKLWYVCGPPPMVQSLKGVLGDIGVPEERLRIENWQIPGKG